MKNHWEEKDIVGGLFVVRETSPIDSQNISFKATVTFKIIWTMPKSGKQEYGKCNVFTDGWVRLYASKKELADNLNADEFGYRPLYRSEYDSLAACQTAGVVLLRAID